MLKLILFCSVFFLTKCNGDICADLANLAPDISEKCLKQLKTVCNNPELLWKMFDASSKYPMSGISYGNNYDLGNYDECLSISFEDSQGKILGKHCTYSMVFVNPLIPANLSINLGRHYHQQLLGYDLVPIEKYVVNGIPDMIKNGAKSTLSTCVPDQCTVKEVGDYFIWGKLENILVFYSNQPCATAETYSEFEAGDIAVIVVFAIFLLLIICSTCYDVVLYYCKRETKHPILLAFSYLTNGRRLLHISENNKEQISCINGLRFISMAWVVAGHTYAAYESAVPITNKEFLEDFRNHWYNQYILSAPIAVDTFFFMSGLLLAYLYFKSNLEKSATKQISVVPMLIVHRYLRITPALAAVYFITITIFRKFGDGAIWVTMVELFKQQCVDHWWAFFLYVQNYVNYSDMCLNPTWYLSADMQMFVLSPLLLIPVALFARNHFKNVLISLGGLAIIFTILPMIIRFADDTIDNVYDTHSRLIDYLIGMIAGLILRQTKEKPFPFSKIQNLIIWIVVLVVCVAFNIYYNDVIARYDHTKDTLFYGLYRPIWAISLTWMVFSCHHGFGGFINWILSRRVFQIGGRLSYCMYLVHGNVIGYYIGNLRAGLHVGGWDAFYMFCGNFIATMIFAAILSLSFELPMLTLEKYIFGHSRQPVKKNTQ